MKCLQWFVDQQIPTMQQLMELEGQIELRIKFLIHLRIVPKKWLLIYLLQLSFLMELFKFGKFLYNNAISIMLINIMSDVLGEDWINKNKPA